MALTRNFLKSMELTEEQVNAIIEGHNNSIEGLKKQRDDALAAAARTEELVQQLQEQAGEGERIQRSFDEYKRGVEAEKQAEQVRKAMDVLLKEEAGIQRESVRRLILDSLHMEDYVQENGRILNAESIAHEMRTRYADFVTSAEIRGVAPVNPPAGSAGRMTRAEIERIADPEARRAAIRDNIDLFDE